MKPALRRVKMWNGNGCRIDSTPLQLCGTHQWHSHKNCMSFRKSKVMAVYPWIALVYAFRSVRLRKQKLGADWDWGSRKCRIQFNVRRVDKTKSKIDGPM